MTAHRAAGHPTLSDEEIADRWDDLKQTGVRRADAAAQLGMTPADLTRTLTRVRDHVRAAELKQNTNTQPQPLPEAGFWAQVRDHQARPVELTNTSTQLEPSMTRDELLTEWDKVLRPSGCSFADAAERLGVNPVKFENQIRQARYSGDERAKPPVQRFGSVYGPPVHDNNRGAVSNPAGEWGGKWAQADEQAKERVRVLAEEPDRDTAGYLRAVREGTVTGGAATTERKAEQVVDQNTQPQSNTATASWSYPLSAEALREAQQIIDEAGPQSAAGRAEELADADAFRRDDPFQWEHTDTQNASNADTDEAVAG